MRSYPRIDARVARALPWLAALTVLTLLGVTRAGAVEAPPQSAPEKATEKAAPPTRPPISPAAVKQATTPAPSETPAQSKSPAPSKAGATTPSNVAAPSKATAAPSKATTAPSASSSAAPDSGMTLRGGQDRTDFRTMTVEGEDRVHLEVERPQLTLDLDPEKVGGLESGTAGDVLNRVAPDLMTAYLESSSHGPSPYLAHPWLRLFATGSVARFQPNVKDVERWKLMVADSKGQTVTTFQGKGDPPKEITWDGRSQGGATVMPGLTYSYVFEAYDKAGNKRNFVGEGFKVSAYRLDSPEGPMLVFSGQSIAPAKRSARSAGMGPDPTAKAIPAVILEAAGWMNQSTRQSQPVRVTATGRSFEQANLLAGRVSAALSELALGDPARIQTVTEVLPDAPDGGTIRIASTPLNLQEIRSNPKAR